MNHQTCFKFSFANGALFSASSVLTVNYKSFSLLHMILVVFSNINEVFAKTFKLKCHDSLIKVKLAYSDIFIFRPLTVYCTFMVYSLYFLEV